jgi:hypothetical protein
MPRDSGADHVSASIGWMVLGLIFQAFEWTKDYSLICIGIGCILAFILVVGQIGAIIRVVYQRCRLAYFLGRESETFNPEKESDLIFSTKAPCTTIVKMFFIRGWQERNR